MLNCKGYCWPKSSNRLFRFEKIWSIHHISATYQNVSWIMHNILTANYLIFEQRKLFFWVWRARLFFKWIYFLQAWMCAWFYVILPQTHMCMCGIGRVKYWIKGSSGRFSIYIAKKVRIIKFWNSNLCLDPNIHSALNITHGLSQMKAHLPWNQINISWKSSHNNDSNSNVILKVLRPC